MLTMTVCGCAPALVPHVLKPLEAETGPNLGKRPELLPAGIFPAKLCDIGSLTGPQLTQLQTFYKHQFEGRNVEARRNSFKAFIGA